MKMRLIFFALILTVSQAFAAAQVGTPAASRPATQPARIRITISKETTYATGPVNPDGTINYVAHLNAVLSKGVTKANNAAIPLLRAAGPDNLLPVSERIRDRTFKLLRMNPLPAEGDYFTTLNEFLKAYNEAEEEQAQENFHKAEKQPWSAKDFPVVADWLKANEKPLALVTAATERPRYYMPCISSSRQPLMLNVLLPSLSQHRRFARALVARAMLKVNSGDAEAALADLLACHRLARLVGQDLTLISRLVAIAVEAVACGADVTLAASGKLSAGQAKAYLAELQALPPLPDMAEAIDKCERLFGLDCIMLMARGGCGKLNEMMGLHRTPCGAALAAATRWQLDWDGMLRMWNSWFDRIAAVHRAGNVTERRKRLAAINAELQRLTGEIVRSPGKYIAMEFLKGTFFSPTRMRRKISRAIGNLLISILLPSLGRAADLYDRAVMKFRLTQMAFALAACKAEKGGYPASLAELSPDYLKEIPLDLFIDKPLHYERVGKGYLLYSVGMNLKDDGGSDDRKKEHDDIVVRVE